MRLALTLAPIAACGLLACAGRTATQTAVSGPAFTTENGVTWITPYGRPTRPFSPAVRVGNMLYLAGQIGTSADGKGGLVEGGIKPETRQTMLNIKDVLEKSGSSLDRVVKCTVFMADMREWDSMNEVYATFFPRNKPARSAFGATGLALGARVEIECFAAVP
ncbi:MAG: putative aminoacrylate peracid reductase RutC [Gemmatimonadaceae bacterium]|nr:putative aminoacrylate peracid reductase RutC [Gemmatimonadaceae bacterium]